MDPLSTVISALLCQMRMKIEQSTKVFRIIFRILFSISSIFIANEMDDGMRWKTRKKIFKNYSSRIILSHMICIQYVLLLISFLSYSKFSFVTIGNYLLACEHKCADILPMTSLSPSIRMACRIC